MRTTTVVCDGCGADRTSTGNCEDYRLALVVESLPRHSHTVTAMAVTPDIDRDHHFCGINCLVTWLRQKGYLKRGE